MMTDLSNEQRRQLIDVAQVFGTYRDADRQLRQSYRGTMRWQKSKGHEYLVRFTHQGARRVGKSEGLRSPETEKLESEYMAARTRLRQRVAKTSARLGEMARVNKALRLNRLPPTATRIVRELDRAGLMGGPLFVVGTNAMFAYEMMAGVLLSSELLATGDIDLLWDDRQTMSLVLEPEVETQGIIGLLRKADKTFRPTGPRSFRAANDDGYLVDLIKPEDRDMRRPGPAKLGTPADDLYGVGIHGLHWLINAPKVSETVIGHDGFPLVMSCIDPRAFALHKLWVSRRDDRDPKHKPRDARAAALVAALCLSHLNVSFASKDLTALPAELRGLAPELGELASELIAKDD